MSEQQSRPAASRGRGSARGGRGGGSTRGGTRIASRTAATNGDSKHDTDSALPTLEDEGEVGQLKKAYGSKVGVIKEIVPDWSEVDILFALRETEGDENLAVTRIAEGTIAQWGEVSKPKKERARPKGKNDTFTTTTADSAPAGGVRPTRGGRVEGGRGRGRATERGGRGGTRGKSTVVTTNGTRNKENALSVPTEESNEWGTTAETTESTWPSEPTPTEPAPAAPSPAPSPAPVAAPKSVENAPKTWASMLRQSTAPKPAPKPKEAPAPKPAEPIIEPLPPAEPTPVEPEVPVAEEESTPEPVEEAPAPVPVVPVVPAVEVPTVVVPEVALPPSKDQLTETNLEQIVDESHPAPTGTARSEATDSWDPRGQAPSATATPVSASQQQHQTRAPTSGFATTATKATERAATRTPSHARRILEQREAVRMPGNRDQVDRAAVQFGSLGFGDVEDIDGEREEPETRPQPPEDSPVAHPRTSLPPAPPAAVPEPFAAQKPVAALPPTGPAAAAPTAPQAVPSAPSQPVQPPTAPSAQYGRFGQPAPQEPASFPTSKPFDSFAQQQANASAAQSQFDGGFPNQVQPAQPQAQQQPAGAFSSAPNEYSSYYTADPQNRNAYNNYYNQNYGQQGAQGQQEGLSSHPQRSFSGYNAPQNDNLSQYPQSGTQHGQSTRFGATTGADAQAGTTPTATQSTTQAQTAQTTQGQSHGQQPHDYPYNSHPYYNNSYYSAYMNYGGAYNQGYGAPYGKGGLGYQQPNQYGMSPQGPHGYGSSPAGGFGQSALHRESGAAAGLSDYTRGGSAQSGQQQGLGSSGFGGMHDAFGRGASGYQSQGGQSFNAPGPQPGSGPSATDELKPFGDAKAAGGPSPSLGAAARPGSAANNAPSQTGLPPPQSAQQVGLSGIGAYGYPNHAGAQGHGLHGNQTGAGGYGMSASGGQGHPNNYGGAGYGGQSFGGSYYVNPPRGWGNNYH